MSSDELHSKVSLRPDAVLSCITILTINHLLMLLNLLSNAFSCRAMLLWQPHANLDVQILAGLRSSQMTHSGVQVKDPSKAAHAADADLKELIENRGMEMKKEPFTEAKCDQKRYDQACLHAALRCLLCIHSCLPRVLIRRMLHQTHVTFL